MVIFSRSQSATMDFNSGVNKKQATEKTRNLRYKQSYSKVTQNWVVKEISEQKYHSYFPSIMK